MDLPADLAVLVEGLPYTCDTVGKSGSAVLCYENMVLKIEPRDEKFAGFVEMLRWLKGRLPVPEVLYAGTEGAFQYLLMSRMPGKMSCDREFTADPDALAELLAEELGIPNPTMYLLLPENKRIDALRRDIDRAKQSATADE